MPLYHAIPIYGLHYYIHQDVVSLPLLGVRAEASIKELAAQVKLTQTYGNDATFPIEAKYSFPIPARASVCSFVMIKQDGTRVVGTVQERQEARETYQTAVAQGQQASLMEQQTPDVFQVAVGNIPSNEQVQIELVYATELSEDEESDSIRFHLPVHIGARYGQAPQSIPSSFSRNVFISSSSPTPFLTLAMSVEAIAPISKIGCPSHSVSTELGPDPKLPNSKQLPFSNYARVSLSSDSPLDKDFILTIKSAGLDAPRCVAELHPTQNTVAMGLTLVPRFKLPDLSRQEFVFMVDRSGSMRGLRIKAAQKALVVMLRALPHQDSLFQIVSFGSRTSSLWPHGSKSYTQQTLEEATHHIDRMQADYGGTEIRDALQHVFKARTRDRPMSVLVLTDGDTWDVDGVLSEVKSAVASAPKNAFLRVSVLGIGKSASTAMCEGMARVGNGTCMMVGEEETTFTGKIARMLKAAKTPPISNISVDWGRPTASVSNEKTDDPPDYDDVEIAEDVNEKQKKKKRRWTLNIFDQSIDDPLETKTAPAPPPPEVIPPPVPPVQRAPFHIQNLFPNIRLNVYAILQGMCRAIPETVILRGSTFDGAEIELPIPVVLSHLEGASGAPPAIHTLAARKIIQDLEDGKHGLAKMLANPHDKDLLARTVKASIIQLGKTYSIASSHTSFVAVDDSQPRQTR
ncbi:von Willebrand factor type A domain-containing protein, partial [Mycena vulgaris]